MARVTVDEVREIFDTSMEFDQITAFITAANLLVTQVCTSTTLPTGLLKEIERYVAAHFCWLRDPHELRSKLGDFEMWAFPAAVTTSWGKGLNLTPYGQTAVALDTSGALANLAMKQASFSAAPRENSGRYTEGLTD